MKNIDTAENNIRQAKSIKTFIIGLLLAGLSGCEKEVSKTTEIDLSLPVMGGAPLTGMTLRDESTLLDSAKVEMVMVETEQTSAVLDSSYLVPIDIAVNAKKLIAPQLLDSLFKGDQFYPLGWSPNGDKFAYAIMNEESGERNVYIQDLISDKLIWKINQGLERDDNPISNNWIENNPKITKGLAQYKIKYKAYIAVKSAPISYQDDTFSYVINPKKSNNGQIDAYRILLRSAAKGNKEISNINVKMTSHEYGNKEKVAVLGYFQGKNKARIATLLGVLETAPRGVKIMRYQIVGASLKYGKWR